MNRKTNIFYLNGNDSKFLTFNNYADSLTGDILATDWKLYPSRFLCIKIDNLNKEDLIKNYLGAYYENKLAFLRDKIDETNLREESILPLNYLLECLIQYASKVNNGTYTTIQSVNQAILDGVTEFPGITFSYISDIVEQDYNGTYSDIICTISPNKRYKFNIIKNNDLTLEDFNTVDYDKNVNYLYGWENDTLSEELSSYVNISLSFDKLQSYFSDSAIKNIEEVEYLDTDKLEFNIIIPLFDVTNIKSDSVKILEDSEETESSSTLILSYQKNVPLGIYFTDNLVELDKDNDTKFSANWSLLISMQFKSFPFSYDIQHSWDNSDSIKDAYLTFAQILAKQTDFIDLLNKYNELIAGLQNKLAKLETGVNNISTTNNIDELNQKINDLTSTLNNKMKEVDTKLKTYKEYIDNSKLKWAVKNNI